MPGFYSLSTGVQSLPDSANLRQRFVCLDPVNGACDICILLLALVSIKSDQVQIRAVTMEAVDSSGFRQ